VKIELANYNLLIFNDLQLLKYLILAKFRLFTKPSYLDSKKTLSWQYFSACDSSDGEQ